MRFISSFSGVVAQELRSLVFLLVRCFLDNALLRDGASLMFERTLC